MPDVWEYRIIEHVRAHNVEHMYKVARIKLAYDTFTSTMEHSMKNLKGIFSLKLLAGDSIHIQYHAEQLYDFKKAKTLILKWRTIIIIINKTIRLL